MYYYVYQITNLINGKIYVGKHKSAKHPFDNDYYGSGKQISAAIEKYGKENFKKEVLYFCSSLEEMSDREAEIVTEDFVKRKDTYNMHKGGPGGWDHYNGSDRHRKNSSKGGKTAAKKLNEFIADQKEKNTEWWQKWYLKVTETNQSKNCNGWSNHSPEEYKARRIRQSVITTGSGNSQYGRIWISNIETKEVKRCNVNDPIPEGWVRGKKGHLPKKLWVNNNETEHYILIEKENEYIMKGYNRGRLKTSMPQNRIVV